MSRPREWAVVAAAWLVPTVAMVLLVVTIFDVPGLKSRADRNAALIGFARESSKDNRALLVYSCREDRRRDRDNALLYRAVARNAAGPNRRLLLTAAQNLESSPPCPTPPPGYERRINRLR